MFPRQGAWQRSTTGLSSFHGSGPTHASISSLRMSAAGSWLSRSSARTATMTTASWKPAQVLATRQYPLKSWELLHPRHWRGGGCHGESTTRHSTAAGHRHQTLPMQVQVQILSQFTLMVLSIYSMLDMLRYYGLLENLEIFCLWEFTMIRPYKFNARTTSPNHESP